jgi:hypothetical protein
LPRLWPRCSRKSSSVLDREAPRTSHPTARGVGVRSSLAALRSKPHLPRRSHQGERYVLRTDSNGTAPAATAAERASLSFSSATSRPPGVWSGHGSASRPILPVVPGTPAPRPDSRSACPSAASSAHGRLRTRPCPHDQDRAPDHPTRQNRHSVMDQHSRDTRDSTRVRRTGVSTASRRLSGTPTRVEPSRRRKASSCSSANIRVLDQNASRGIDLRL